MPGQRDVEVSHDVTFDENNALGMAKDLLVPRKDNDDVAEKQDEPLTDEPMLDVEGLMDPIDPPPSIPLPQEKDLYGSKMLLKMPKDMLLQEGHSVKARSRTGIKGT